MKEPAYPAARTVSSVVHAHFARHQREVLARSPKEVAPLPDAAIIEEIIEAAFWTSLRREEGFMPRISLAFLSAEQAIQPLIFERPLPLRPDALARVAPAVEGAGIHLGLWPDEGELRAWGMTRTVPPLCLVLEVPRAVRQGGPGSCERRGRCRNPPELVRGAQRQTPVFAARIRSRSAVEHHYDRQAPDPSSSVLEVTADLLRDSSHR